MILAAGCSGTDEKDTLEIGISQSQVEAAEEVTYDKIEIQGPTRRVIDMVGREVTIPDNPQHLAALWATTGHMITMLDAGDRIDSVNNGLKRDILLNQLEPAIEDAVLSVVSGQINIESLLEKDIDLALVPVDIYSEHRQVEQLESIGIPYVVVDFQSIDEQIQLVELIGDIVGNQEEATSYKDFYYEIINLLNEKVGDLKEDEKIGIYHSINEANCTVEVDTLPADWMSYTGARNVSLNGDLEQDGDKYYTNLEQILIWNPEVIYCNEGGVPEYIKDNTQWSMVEAVQEGRVEQLPVGISRWGHKTSIETPLAMLWVANDLYPERFAGVDVFSYYKRYYEEFFEFTLTEDLYEEMLAGEGMRLNKNLEEDN